MKNVLTKITKLAFIFRTRDGGSSIRSSKTFFSLLSQIIMLNPVENLCRSNNLRRII